MTDTAADTNVVPEMRLLVAHCRRFLQACIGIGLIVLCLEAGTFIQHILGLPVPGSVLGMVILLCSLRTGLIRDTWIQQPCTWLLLLLPALFVPIYVVPLSDAGFWQRYGLTLVPAAVAGFVVTLALTGWLAARLQRQ